MKALPHVKDEDTKLVEQIALRLSQPHNGVYSAKYWAAMDVATFRAKCDRTPEVNPTLEEALSINAAQATKIEGLLKALEAIEATSYTAKGAAFEMVKIAREELLRVDPLRAMTHFQDGDTFLGMFEDSLDCVSIADMLSPNLTACDVAVGNTV